MQLPCGYGRCTGRNFIDPWPSATIGARQEFHRQVLCLQTPLDPPRGVLRACALTPLAMGTTAHPFRGLTRALLEHTGGRHRIYLAGPGAKLYACAVTTRLRVHMQPQRVTLADHGLRGKRAWVESVHDPRKNIAQGEPTRHCSPVNFWVNLLAGLMAYCHPPRKPPLARGHRFPEPASYP